MVKIVVYCYRYWLMVFSINIVNIGNISHIGNIIPNSAGIIGLMSYWHTSNPTRYCWY